MQGGRETLNFIFKSFKKVYGPQHWWPARTRFEVIVGAILTQNASWANVVKALARLKRSGPLSIKRLHKIPINVLAGHIRPAGYFNLKARRLKNFINFLNDRYSGSLDRLFKEPAIGLRNRLLEVNGIGPETADSIVLYAAAKPSFVVDAYTRRIFSRVGLISEGSSYEQVQRYFMSNLPPNVRLFNEFHALIVEHAKRVCKKSPDCPACVIRPVCRFFLSAHLKKLD